MALIGRTTALWGRVGDWQEGVNIRYDRVDAAMNHRAARFLTVATVLSLLIPGSARATTSNGPKRVLIINSFGRNFEPYSSASASFRNELAQRASVPIEFFEVSLETARFAEGDIDKPIAEYLRVLFQSRPPDLVVPIASPALRFCARHRDDTFAGMPILAVATEQRHIDAVKVAPPSTAIGFTLDLPGLLSDALALLPETRHVGVVLGDSPLERFWGDQLRREWASFDQTVDFEWFGGLPFADIVQRCAALPPHSIVVFATMDVDGAGVPYEQHAALGALRDATSAPIFGVFEEEVGRGVVGGRLLRVRDMGAAGAHVAVRILDGESAGAIAPTTIDTPTPVYDWRELRRWKIAESLLPPHSEIRHRAPSYWEANRTRILAVGAFIALQTLLIVVLFTSRARLHTAQAEQRKAVDEAQELRRELSHADRVTLLGQFTTSLAHELGQPLGAILRNADAAELFLKRPSPDTDEVQAILHDVRRDAERAGAVIERLRALLKRRRIEAQALPWSKVVDDVVGIVRGDAATRRITLEVRTDDGLPPARGDRVHLQQVLLNLVANAMDAIDSRASGDRRVSIRSRVDGSWIECAVSDTGTGVGHDSSQWFEPYVTNKPGGMGMGLPISRTIVEAHGGRIWVESDSIAGTTLRFTIPVDREATA